MPSCGSGSTGLGGPISLPDPLPCSAETNWQVSGFVEGDVGADALLLPVGHSRELFVYEGPSLGGGRPAGPTRGLW